MDNAALYSPPHRGGVDAPSRRCCEATFERRGRGGLKQANVLFSDHPVCASKERDHFLTGAFTPPLEEGNTFRFSHNRSKLLVPVRNGANSAGLGRSQGARSESPTVKDAVRTLQKFLYSVACGSGLLRGSMNEPEENKNPHERESVLPLLPAVFPTLHLPTATKRLQSAGMSMSSAQ